MVIPDAPQEPLTQEDYEALKNSMKRHRDILLCKILRATGLRISEVLALTPAHLKEKGPDFYLMVRRGKTRREPRYEAVLIRADLGIELRDWAKGNGVKAAQPLFGIKRRQTLNIFHDAGMKAIGRRVHPHEFRGLYITTLIDTGVPLEAVSKMVGHEDIRSTLKDYFKLNWQRRLEIQRRIPV
ncbi:MAG: tyrosine-type recombinase/integrase [Chloroflexota bacterium]